MIGVSLAYRIYSYTAFICLYIQMHSFIQDTENESTRALYISEMAMRRNVAPGLNSSRAELMRTSVSADTVSFSVTS